MKSNKNEKKEKPKEDCKNSKRAGKEKIKSKAQAGIFEILAIAAVSLFVLIASPMLAKILGEWSYAGAFALAFLSSASIFIPAGPLQLAIAALGRNFDPLLLGIIAGIGSGIGELTGFFVGRGSAEILSASKSWMKWLVLMQQGLVKKWAGAGIFLLAAIPNPLFDVAGIGAGLIGMRWWEFLAWCILGRTLRFILIAYAGAWSAGLI